MSLDNIDDEYKFLLMRHARMIPKPLTDSWWKHAADWLRTILFIGESDVNRAVRYATERTVPERLKDAGKNAATRIARTAQRKNRHART